MNNKAKQILAHIIGCIIFLMLPILFSPDFMRSDELYKIPPFQKDFMSYFFLLLFFYLCYYLFLPKFYFNKKYFAFALCIILSYVVINLVPNALINDDHFFHGKHFHDDMSDKPHRMGPPQGNYFMFILGHHFFQFLIVLMFALFLKFYNRLKQTEKEKISTELSYLKAQINPHFLFNTLNSIYATAIEERAKNTASAVVKLSGMMRYVISEADTDFISLDKEINYISDYVDLQKVRLENTVLINYKVNGNISGKQIAPLILIPFIENAFKHGVNGEENSSIQINIDVEKTKLTMTVVNNKVRTIIDDNLKSGLGIENTRQRLELIYAGKHHLQITDDEKIFKVILTLEF